MDIIYEVSIPMCEKYQQLVCIIRYMVRGEGNYVRSDYEWAFEQMVNIIDNDDVETRLTVEGCGD